MKTHEDSFPGATQNLHAFNKNLPGIWKISATPIATDLLKILYE